MAEEKRHPNRKTKQVRGRRDDTPEVRLSKTLSYALRHGAEELGLNMRPSGFVELNQLLALPLFRLFTREQVDEVVRTNSKKRFTMTTDPTGQVAYIRANQGHSLQIVNDQELLTPMEDPSEIDRCIHGTYLKFWPSILEQGLSRMTRNHIHFTPLETETVAGEVVSGMRATCDLLLYVDFPTALADGIRFYRSSNGVVLSPGQGDTGAISALYFLRAVTRDGSVVFERDQLIGN